MSLVARQYLDSGKCLILAEMFMDMQLIVSVQFAVLVEIGSGGNVKQTASWSGLGIDGRLNLGPVQGSRMTTFPCNLPSWEHDARFASERLESSSGRFIARTSLPLTPVTSATFTEESSLPPKRTRRLLYVACVPTSSLMQSRLDADLPRELCLRVLIYAETNRLPDRGPTTYVNIQKASLVHPVSSHRAEANARKQRLFATSINTPFGYEGLCLQTGVLL